MEINSNCLICKGNNSTLNGVKIQRCLTNLTAKQAKKVAWVLNLVEEHINVPSKYFKKMVNTDNL